MGTLESQLGLHRPPHPEFSGYLVPLHPGTHPGLATFIIPQQLVR